MSSPFNKANTQEMQYQAKFTGMFGDKDEVKQLYKNKTVSQVNNPGKQTNQAMGSQSGHGSSDDSVSLSAANPNHALQISHSDSRSVIHEEVNGEDEEELPQMRTKTQTMSVAVRVKTLKPKKGSLYSSDSDALQTDEDLRIEPEHKPNHSA